VCVPRKIDWDNQIGRRLKLRDLHVFFTVVRRRSMAKAAAHLGVSQAAVSEIIANLEHTLGVRLLDRHPRGVEPTIYGSALLKRGTIAFDELRQSVRDIESLADPTIGELRIGCAESMAAAILPPIIQGFSQQYPRVVLRVKDVVAPTLELPELRERSLDVVLARFLRPLSHEDDDLNVEILFHDEMVVVAGMQSPWASRETIDLSELVHEPWILPPPDSWNYINMAEAFRAHGLDMPKTWLVTFSVHLRTSLLPNGPYITAFPASVLRFNPNLFAMKVLPVDIPVRPWPVAIITLKNRTLSPVVEQFIDHVRAFARTMDADFPPLKKSPLEAGATAPTRGHGATVEH
jgi:DNA-binding transcriptional LysR family regulator